LETIFEIVDSGNSKVAGMRLFAFSFNFVFAAESFHTAGRIYQLLLTGEKRMAIGTDFYFDYFLGRTGWIFRTTGTGYSHFKIFGMDTGSHFITSSKIFNSINGFQFPY